MNIYSIFIYNSKKLKTKQTALNKQMVKHTVVGSYHGIHGTLFSNKKKYELFIYVITWINPKDVMASEKASLKWLNIIRFNLLNFIEMTKS